MGEQIPKNDSLSDLQPGLSAYESFLLNSPLPHDLSEAQIIDVWDRYQRVIAKLLLRMGSENALLDSLARVAVPYDFRGIFARFALIPKLSSSAIHAIGVHGIASDTIYRVAGECSLMELSAAAGYRTFCMPDLVRGLLKTNKMRDQSFQRMMDTFDFLNSMMQFPFNDKRVKAHFARTNYQHGKYKVAGNHHQGARDLFKYIALNMFYIGPSMRPDLTPEEHHAICGLAVLVSKQMGHIIEGSVTELRHFIDEYENKHMFARDDQSSLRHKAIEIALASKQALYKIPTISPAKIHSYVPHRVKKILLID